MDRNGYPSMSGSVGLGAFGLQKVRERFLGAIHSGRESESFEACSRVASFAMLCANVQKKARKVWKSYHQNGVVMCMNKNNHKYFKQRVVNTIMNVCIYTYHSSRLPTTNAEIFQPANMKPST